MHISVKFLLLTFLHVVQGGGGPSDEPIAVTPPNLPGGQIANDAPPGPFFDGFRPPFPTDACMTLSSFPSGHVAGPFPFQSATTNTGLKFGIGDNREFDGTSVKVQTQDDFTVSIGGLPDVIGNRKATSWDSISVCLQYFAGSSTMDTCLVPGAPYMTFVFKNAEIVITSEQGDLSFSWVTPGRKARVVTSTGVTYLIYITEGTANLGLSTVRTITSSPGTSATLRFIKIKDGANNEVLLDQFSASYATGVDYRYSITGDSATTTWTYEVSGGSPDNLLIMSWPHHRDLLQSPDYVALEYSTLKGRMRGVKGNVWRMSYDLPTITWFAKDPIHPSCLSELTKTLESDVAGLKEMVPGDFYFWGGAFGRAARLALIAEQVGRMDLVDQVVGVLKQSIGHWFDPAHVPAAAFETGWGGFINKEGWNNSWVDFGNAYYNDHHFHYGYILEGAAVIGKYDAAWLNQNLEFLMQIARNVGNPSPADPHYTVTRHMDFFAGHSWASGIANGAGPRDQESSGEAINGYYGLLLFATVTNNQKLIDWSRLLLAIEIKGAQVYWHLYPNAPTDATPYPEKAFRDLITIGNVMDAQAGAWLFWGADRIQIAAIQILPLTPIGQLTYDKEWMEGVLPYCKQELDDVTMGDDFKSVIYAAYAKVNPQEAYGYSSKLSDWGSGNSASNQLYFVATQPSATDICSASAQTPEGLHLLQDAGSGKFVTISGDGALAATTSADVLASKFVLGFTPGGGTIQAHVSGKFVTASPGGTSPLAAARDSPGSYEVFRWSAQGANYQLTAMVNRAEVSFSPDGSLLNNANSTNGVAPGVFKLVPTEDTPPPAIPASATIQSVENSRYVLSDPVLRTTGSAPGSATRWLFAKVSGTADTYTIQNPTTGQYVTGNMGGTVALSATAPVAQAWEHFQIVAYQSSYLILHVASGMPVAVQPDDTLMDNTNAISTSTMWRLSP